MKKLTLTVASLLAGSTLFAQSNESKIVETGDYNQAVVTQAGTHTSSVFQASSAQNLADKNLTTVTQNNINAYSISESESVVEQYGKSHISTVLQTGKNYIEVFIGSDGTSPSENVDNETNARQYGFLNSGLQVIRGATANQSLLSLDQGGTNNNSVQTASWAVSSKGIVVQNGNENDVWQQIDGTRDEAYTTQLGDQNYSYQWIENGSSQDNINTVIQTGNGNISRVITKGDDNRFSLLQIGNNNKLVGLAGGIYSNAEQTGDDNVATITQSGDDNEVLLQQSGDGNTIKGTSIAGAFQLGSSNKAIFSQNGDNLTIISKQFGHQNLEDAAQTGDGHISNVKQLGNQNSSIGVQANNP